LHTILYFIFSYMTVIDQVLTAEKASESKLSEAREAAVVAVAVAKKAQVETLLAEKTRLAEVEKTELASHSAQVEKTAQGIISKADVTVKAVEGKFAQRSTEIVKKIKEALS
jgi:hypothetical protein